MLNFINKFSFILIAIIVGFPGVGFADSNDDNVDDDKVFIDSEEITRSPFSTPKGIRTVIETFTEGEVAESVVGIFRSGANVRAVINGKWTEEGAQIGDEKVLEISKDAVVMVGKEGEKRELLLPWTEAGLKVIKKVKPPKIIKEEK